MAKKQPCIGCGTLSHTYRNAAGQVSAVRCRQCRKLAVQHGAQATYKKHGCRCEPCREAWAKYNAKYAHARRATLRQVATVDLIDPAVIYERDAWQCGICDLAVDPREQWPSPGAPSLDHITPISRGGLHVESNVQLAHLYCNAVKGNRMAPAC